VPAAESGSSGSTGSTAACSTEHRVAIEAETLGLAREFPRIGPEAVKGIEINPYAAELARVTVWISEIQWMRRNGFDAYAGRVPAEADLVVYWFAKAWEQTSDPAFSAHCSSAGSIPASAANWARITPTATRSC
jgi:hypothetical protein